MYKVSGLLWYGMEGERGGACKLNCRQDVQRNFDATTSEEFISTYNEDLDWLYLQLNMVVFMFSIF